MPVVYLIYSLQVEYIFFIIAVLVVVAGKLHVWSSVPGGGKLQSNNTGPYLACSVFLYSMQANNDFLFLKIVEVIQPPNTGEYATDDTWLENSNIFTI